MFQVSSFIFSFSTLEGNKRKKNKIEEKNKGNELN
jgi:hypothetical protein